MIKAHRVTREIMASLVIKAHLVLRVARATLVLSALRAVWVSLVLRATMATRATWEGLVLSAPMEIKERKGPEATRVALVLRVLLASVVPLEIQVSEERQV